MCLIFTVNSRNTLFYTLILYQIIRVVIDCPCNIMKNSQFISIVSIKIRNKRWLVCFYILVFFFYFWLEKKIDAIFNECDCYTRMFWRENIKSKVRAYNNALDERSFIRVYTVRTKIRTILFRVTIMDIFVRNVFKLFGCWTLNCHITSRAGHTIEEHSRIYIYLYVLGTKVYHYYIYRFETFSYKRDNA